MVKNLQTTEARIHLLDGDIAKLTQLAEEGTDDED